MADLEHKRSIPTPVRIVLVLVVLTVLGLTLWATLFRAKAIPTNVVFVSGRIESDDSSVAPKVSGRIREISVREGDSVKVGQVLATLDDAQIRAREEQASSVVSQSEARVQRARQQIAVLQQQLLQSEIGIDQAQTDAQGRVSQAEAQVASAEASLAQAQTNYEQARYDAERFGELAKEGIEPERVARQTKAIADAQAEAVRAARKQIDAAKGALEAARANLANPSIRKAQTAGIQQQINQAKSDVSAAEADLERARAQLTEAQANRADLVITAPIDGTIATRSAEPGEIVSPGTPIVTIVNLEDVYLRGFIPQSQIDRIKVSQSARVYLDGNPNQPIDAYVSRVDPEASFTPENTYFRDDRVKQVVGVKLTLRGAVGLAKPGMSADGEVLVEGETWPAGTRTN